MELLQSCTKPSIWSIHDPVHRSMLITHENFMMIWWQEHSEKGVTDGLRRTDRQMDGGTEVFLELLKIRGQGLKCSQWSKWHSRPSFLLIYIHFISHQSHKNFSWNTAIFIFDLENQRSRSWGQSWGERLDPASVWRALLFPLPVNQTNHAWYVCT